MLPFKILKTGKDSLVRKVVRFYVRPDCVEFWKKLEIVKIEPYANNSEYKAPRPDDPVFHADYGHGSKWWSRCTRQGRHRLDSG